MLYEIKTVQAFDVLKAVPVKRLSASSANQKSLLWQAPLETLKKIQGFCKKILTIVLAFCVRVCMQPNPAAVFNNLI